MTEKPTIEMLYQALKDFKDNFDKFQSEYGKGVDRHRNEHKQINQILNGNGQVGICEETRNNKERLNRLDEMLTNQKRYRKWLIGYLTTVGIAILGFILDKLI